MPRRKKETCIRSQADAREFHSKQAENARLQAYALLDDAKRHTAMAEWPLCAGEENGMKHCLLAQKDKGRQLHESDPREMCRVCSDAFTRQQRLVAEYEARARMAVRISGDDLQTTGEVDFSTLSSGGVWVELRHWVYELEPDEIACPHFDPGSGKRCGNCNNWEDDGGEEE